MYIPTGPGQERPAPPEPDTPNTGRVHAHPGYDIPLDGPPKRRLRPTFTEVVGASALVWFVTDLALRLT